MKKQIMLFVCLYSLGMVLIPGCSQKNEKKELKIEVTEKVMEGTENGTIASIGVEGMTCEIGCAGYIKEKLSKMDGVISAEVLFEENTAKVKYDESKLSEKELISEIEKLNDGQYSVIKVEIEKTVKKSQPISAVKNKKQSFKVSGKEKVLKDSSTEKVSYQPSFKPVVFPNVFNLVKLFIVSEK